MESPDILMNSGLPVATAFVLGLLTAISPCPLATNITAIGFNTRDIANRKRILRNGLLYTMRRIITYTVLGLLVIPILREGESMFAIQKGISQWGGMDYFTFTIAYRWIYAMGATVESSEIRFFGRQ